MAKLPDIPVDLWRSYQNTIFGEKADDIQEAESFRWGVDDALGQLPPDDGVDHEAEVRRLEEEQQRRQEEQRRQIEEQARRDQEDYQRIEEERAVAARANELAASAPPGTSTYNDPTAGGTINQPLPPQGPAPASFADTANSLITGAFGPEPAPMPEDASRSERYVHSLSEPSEPVPPPLRNDISHDPQTNTYGPASPAPAEPLSFADQANSLITGAFGPESPIGQAASGAYNTAVRGGMPDVIDIARKGDEGARYAIDTYGAGRGVKDDARIRELQAEASGGDTSNRGILDPTIDPAWAAQNPDKAQELDDLSLNRTMTFGGMAGAGGGGGIARDAIDAIKALRSAGMGEAALNAERELAMKSPMTLEQIQRQTGAAIKTVADAALPKPPLEVPNPSPLTAEERALNAAADARAREAPPHSGYLEDPTFGADEPPTAGPRPGDRIRLPDGTRARVEEPASSPPLAGPAAGRAPHPSQMTPEEFEATGEDLLHGTGRQFDRFDPEARTNAKRRTQGFFFTDDPAVARRFAQEGQRAESISAGAVQEARGSNYGVGDLGDIIDAEAGLDLPSLRAAAKRRLDQGFSVFHYGDDGNLRPLTDPGALGLDDLESGVMVYRRGEAPRTISTRVYGHTLDLRRTADWPADLVERLRTSKETWDQRLYEAWQGSKSHPLRGQEMDGQMVYLPLANSPTLKTYAAERGIGKIRTKDAHESGYGSTYVPDTRYIGYGQDPYALLHGAPRPAPLAGTVYQPPSTTAGGGGGRLPPSPPPAPPGGGRQAPPGMYTTLNPPGPLAPTGGGGAGGGMAPGGVPPAGGGNLPPVGSLYRNQPSSSKDLPSLGSVARWFVRQNTDRRVDLNDLQKGVANEIGRPLNPDELVSELSRRNTNQAANVRLQEGLRPVFTSMGKDLPYLSEALTYLDNIAVSRALGTPNRTFSWGLTAADSQARLPQLINQMGGIHDPRAQKLNQAIQDVRAFTDSYRKRMLDSGVWSQDLYNDLTTRYPTYIPTRILDYLKDDAAVASGKKLGLSDRGLRSHTLGGTSLEREDPLASIVRLSYDSERRINQNETFNAFVKLRDASPQLQQQIKQVPTTYTAKDGETLVHGFVDGEKRIYAMTHPLAQAVQMDDGQQLPAFVRGVTNGFRALITHSPVFIAGQVPLDAFSYGVREAGRSTYGPLALPRIATDLVRSYGEAFRGLATGEFKGDAAALLREGGGMAGWQGRSREAAKSKVDELSHQNMFEIRNKGDVGRLIKWIATMQPVAAVGERVELAPRIASYRRAGRRMTDQTTSALLQPATGGAPIPVPQRGQRPLSSVERVMAARDVTLDFERGGKLSRVLNQAIPFYNVGWQSSAAVARAARENPVGFSVSALSIVGGLAVGAEAWNRSDPQLEKDYEDVPDYIKDRGVVFMLPGNAPLDKDGNRRPNYLTIPMRELAPIAILAREAALKVAGKDTRAWDEILGASAAAASPIQATGGADLFSSFNPVGLNTGLQVYADKDFFRGQNIDTKFRREEASAASKALSATAQQHGLELSPAQIEFILRDLGGGASRAGLAASDMLAGKARDDSRIQNTPLAGDLIRRYVGDATGGVMNRERAHTIKLATRAKLRAGGVEYVPGPVDFEIKNVPLTRSEVGALQTKTNQYIEENLTTLLANEDWPTWSAKTRDEAVKRAAERARARARGDLLEQIGWDRFSDRAEQARAAGAAGR